MILYWTTTEAPANQLVKAHEDDAGYDLRAAETFSLARNSSRLVHTGLYIAIPKGFVGLVKSRSGLAVKQGIEAGAGVIDAGYRGEVCVLLHNLGDAVAEFKKGDRVAQLLVLKLSEDEASHVSSLSELSSTGRGSDGFGSTGL